VHGQQILAVMSSHDRAESERETGHSMACSSRVFEPPGSIVARSVPTATQHEDRHYPENWFPFGNAVTTDPFSGNTGAILKGRPTDPLMMIEVNTSTEYWQKGASPVHTDPAGRHDAELPPTARFI
jgi:hypothetical protein